jgi:hypothetical protein
MNRLQYRFLRIMRGSVKSHPEKNVKFFSHKMKARNFSETGGAVMSNRDYMINMIEEGMQVFDNQGNKVGTVEFIHFSEANGSETFTAASTPAEPSEWNLIDIIGKFFGSDNLPEELRERLLMHGFIRIDSAKLFGADRYVMPDQIAKVDKNGVHLKVADGQELLKG